MLRIWAEISFFFCLFSPLYIVSKHIVFSTALRIYYLSQVSLLLCRFLFYVLLVSPLESFILIHFWGVSLIVVGIHLSV